MNGPVRRDRCDRDHSDGTDSPSGTGLDGLVDPVDEIGARFVQQDMAEPVVADLEYVGREHLARPATDALVNVQDHLHERTSPPGFLYGSAMLPLTGSEVPLPLTGSDTPSSPGRITRTIHGFGDGDLQRSGP